MDEFQGPVISKPNGRLGRRNPSTDSVMGLVAGGVAVAGKVALGQIVKLIQPGDAAALGINAAYDANNDVLVYHHIQRYFFYNPDATLYLMLVAQDTTLTSMCSSAGAVHTLLTDEATAGTIRVVGVVKNASVATVPGDFSNGLLTDVLEAIVGAQSVLDTLASEANYVDNILLEGVLSSTATIGTLPSLRTLACDSVSVCVAADPAVYSATGAYAAIGSALGMLSIRKVSECLGSVDVISKPAARRGTNTYPLTSTASGYFLGAALSNGRAFAKLSTADKSALSDKGYIYAGKFAGFDGVYFNDSHTCTEASSDYAYIEDSRVWNKATRLLRAGILPVFRGQVEVDASTGYMTAGTTASFEAKGRRAVMPMAANGEISGEPTVTIAPNQDVVGTSKVSLELSYVRQAILRKLDAVVGAVNPAAGQ